MPRTCEYEHCRIEFEPKRADQVFCCRRHKELEAQRNHKKKGGITINGNSVCKIEYFRCPICGTTKKTDVLSKHFELELMYKVIKSRGGLISWERGATLTDGDVNELKRTLVFTFKDLTVDYTELNGCKLWDDCCTCPRDIKTQCSDTVRGYSLKLKKAPRKQKARELIETMPIEQVADELGVCKRTIKRDLGGK